jgi:hypothetical protein
VGSGNHSGFAGSQVNTTGMSQPSTAAHTTDSSIMNKTGHTDPGAGARQVVPSNGVSMPSGTN